MKNFFKGIGKDFSRWNAKMLCRAGVIAALYTVLTWALGSLAYGPLQVRPAEALCVLPLFFPEAIPALYIGCILANLFSGYGVYDIFLGSLATLVAAFLTYCTGKIFKNHVLKVAIGGIFPIMLNAFIIPAVWILAGTPDVVYWYEFAVMILNEALWIYVLGIPLYYAILRLRKRGVSVFMSPVHAAAGSAENGSDNTIPPDISPNEQNKKE
ncbi:MAG: QueT transporter family protein [Clostridia bacterium]|nr:QueT transporter family protein [Clostridia bacterium]